MKLLASSRLFPSLVLFILSLACIEYAFGWNEVLVPWGAVSPDMLILAAILTVISYGIRAFRLYDYFFIGTRHCRFTTCLKLTLLHNLFNNLLPMRTGEASFTILMARYFAIPPPCSVIALLWFRLMDLHILSAVALVVVGINWLGAWFLGLMTVTWLLLPFGLFQLQQTSILDKMIKRVLVLSRWRSHLVVALSGLPQTKAAFWRAWFWTLLNWLVKLAVFSWILQLFSPLSATAALLGVIGGDLTSVLPIHGIAGAGTYEAGVVAAMVPFGVSVTQALVAAINMHLFMLGLSIAGGGMALLLSHDPNTTKLLQNHG